MKRSIRLLPRFLAAISLACVATAVPARSHYSIRQHSFTAVGGKSTGGSYALYSAVGSPALAKTTGGNFAVTGSPWKVVVLQSTGGPILRLTVDNGNARISWPTSATGFVLQETSELRSPPAITDWQKVSITPADNGTEKSVTVSNDRGMKYYRLSLQTAP